MSRYCKRPLISENEADLVDEDFEQPPPKPVQDRTKLKEINERRIARGVAPIMPEEMGESPQKAATEAEGVVDDPLSDLLDPPPPEDELVEQETVFGEGTEEEVTVWVKLAEEGSTDARKAVDAEYVLAATGHFISQEPRPSPVMETSDMLDFIENKLTPEQFEGYLIGHIMEYTFNEDDDGISHFEIGSWYYQRLVATRAKRNKTS